MKGLDHPWSYVWVRVLSGMDQTQTRLSYKMGPNIVNDVYLGFDENEVRNCTEVTTLESYKSIPKEQL